MAKKGQRVWTGGDDEAAIAKGVYDTYAATIFVIPKRLR